MIPTAFLICALAIPVSSVFHPPLEQKDINFFRALIEITGGPLVFADRETPWETIREAVFKMPGGTVFLLEKKFKEVDSYFKGRNFERFPMMWRKYFIYRKRGYSSA